MNYTNDIPYLYGKLNHWLEHTSYKGKSTETATTTVNNETNEISVNVNLNRFYTKEQVDEKIAESMVVKTYFFTDEEENENNPPKWVLDNQDPEQFDSDFSNAILCGINFENVVCGLNPLESGRIRYSCLHNDTTNNTYSINTTGIELEKQQENDSYYYTLKNQEAEPFYNGSSFIHYPLTIQLVNARTGE